MANITYNRTFTHVDWIDDEDIVQAGGEKGFNVEFHAFEAEFDNISGVIAQLSAGLGAFQPVGAGGAVAYTGGNVGIGSGFSTANPPTYRLEVNLGRQLRPSATGAFWQCGMLQRRCRCLRRIRGLLP